MPSPRTFLILCAGAAAGLLFSFSGAGALFIYFSAFPLLLLGLAWGSSTLVPALIVACIAGALLTDAGGGIFFALFTALPAFYFVHGALRWRERPEGKQWYPVLRVLTEMIGCAAVVFAAAGLLAAHHEPGGLAGLVKRAFVIDMQGADPQMRAMMRRLVDDWSFLLFAITAWSWLLAFYALAVLGNSLLASRHHALRPSLGLDRTALPLWLLGGLLASGALFLWGQPGDRFLATVLILLIALPYFLSGLTLLHAVSASWRGRGFWLLLFYFTLFTSLFPAILAAITGLAMQVAEILDKRRRMG